MGAGVSIVAESDSVDVFASRWGLAHIVGTIVAVITIWFVRTRLALAGATAIPHGTYISVITTALLGSKDAPTFNKGIASVGRADVCVITDFYCPDASAIDAGLIVCTRVSVITVAVEFGM